ncbi:MAG: hypothetical protein CMJ70_27790 [Planctomycetaceae bacterium]|nr:hypothetical protein [Planctomycetaceae bacterium]
MNGASSGFTDAILTSDATAGLVCWVSWFDRNHQSTMDHAYRNDWRLDRLQPVLDALSSLNSGLSAARYGDDLSTAPQASFAAVTAARRSTWSGGCRSGVRCGPRRNPFSRKPVGDV